MKWNSAAIAGTALCLMAGMYSCQPAGTDNTQAPHNPLMDHEEEITQIIAQMTLEEKVEMLHGKHMFSSAGVERLGIADIEYADGPFGIREEMEPHSWRSLGLANDSATFFPTGSALAATWSPELAYQYGRGMAIEARLRGKDMILGPAINIQRLPTGGRTYEYLSEDPFLSAELSVGYTQGVQDNGAAVCLKHYALNNQENMRGFISSNASERVVRELYLPPFEAAVRRANAYGVMAAYNKVDGVWCSENDLLQNKILRDEWGFRGIIISDWGGTHSTVGAAVGGLDVEMPGQTYLGQPLIDSVNAGVVPMEVIDAKVRNLLRVRLTIPAVPAEEANRVMTSQLVQQQIAYDVASKSIVMLKNDAVGEAAPLLPLDLGGSVKTIAVIGDNATKTMAQGGVGAGVKTLYEITPLAGLEKALEGTGVELLYAQGYASRPQQWGGKPEIDEKAEARKAVELCKEALELAAKADVVIFVGGDNRIVETEGSDRQSITLPFGQDALVEALAEVNPRLVTVVVAGAPVDLQRVSPRSQALLYSWFNGSEGGHALADVLTGRVSPSGRLPFTLPVRLEDSPAYALGVYPQKEKAVDDVFMELVAREKFRAQRNADADYGEGLLVGYRWFTTKQLPTAYPFGYGLTYGDFAYSNAEAKVKGNTIEVSFTLDNNGLEAEEVAQVYVARPESKVERPAYELKGFKRVALKNGEEQRVTLTIDKAALRHWDEQTHGWVLEPGKAVVKIGRSSEDLPLSVEVSL